MKAMEITGGSMRIVVDDILADEGHAVTFWSGSAERPGKRLDAHGIMAFKVNDDGKFTESWWLYDDQAAYDDFFSGPVTQSETSPTEVDHVVAVLVQPGQVAAVGIPVPVAVEQDEDRFAHGDDRPDGQADGVDGAQAGVGHEEDEVGIEGCRQVSAVAVGRDGRAGAADGLDQADLCRRWPAELAHQVGDGERRPPEGVGGHGRRHRRPRTSGGGGQTSSGDSCTASRWASVAAASSGA